jgi:cysteine-rich repeat protein
MARGGHPADDPFVVARSGLLRGGFVAICLGGCADDTAASGGSDSSGAGETLSPTGVTASASSSADTSNGAGTSSSDASTSDADTSTSEGGTASATSSSTGALPQCGDDTRDPGEECDDGNLLDDDGCDADCVPSQVVQIAGNVFQHTCVRTRTGAVRCWGRGINGQLGYGNIEDVGDDEVPADVGSVDVGGVVVHLSGGYAHTCAVLDDGAVRCWGGGMNGRLGYGNTQTIGDDETPAVAGDVDVGGFAVQVTTGASHTCVLLDDGDVRCWGIGSAGELGYGNLDPIGDNEAPAIAGDVAVGGGGVVVQIAAGSSHTCARLTSGAVRCWGWNDHGQLGLGHTDSIGDDEPPSIVPDVVVLGPDEDDEVVGITATIGHSCALLASGNARCWGQGEAGILGHGNTEDIGDDETPASAGNIAFGGIAVELSAGPCVRLEDGDVRCWGAGSSGALGLGSVANIGDDELPSSTLAVSLGGPAVHVHSDGLRACAVLEGGEVRCWGFNAFGQLGYGNTSNIGDDPGELPSTVGPVQVF